MHTVYIPIQYLPTYLFTYMYIYTNLLTYTHTYIYTIYMYTKHMCNTYIEYIHLCNTLYDISIQYINTTHIYNTYIEYIYRIHIYNTYIQYILLRVQPSPMLLYTVSPSQLPDWLLLCVTRVTCPAKRIRRAVDLFAQL